MMRGTRGFFTGCGAVVALTLVVGCAQTGQNNQRPAGRAAQPAGGVTPIQAAANVAGAVVNTAAGAVNGAVSGAQAASGAQPARKRPRIKPNGRGGFDSSEMQQAVLKQAHAISDRYGTKPAPRRSSR